MGSHGQATLQRQQLPGPRATHCCCAVFETVRRNHWYVSVETLRRGADETGMKPAAEAAEGVCCYPLLPFAMAVCHTVPTRVPGQAPLSDSTLPTCNVYVVVSEVVVLRKSLCQMKHGSLNKNHIVLLVDHVLSDKGESAQFRNAHSLKEEKGRIRRSCAGNDGRLFPSRPSSP